MICKSCAVIAEVCPTTERDSVCFDDWNWATGFSVVLGGRAEGGVLKRKGLLIKCVRVNIGQQRASECFRTWSKVYHHIILSNSSNQEVLDWNRASVGFVVFTSQKWTLLPPEYFHSEEAHDKHCFGWGQGGITIHHRSWQELQAKIINRFFRYWAAWKTLNVLLELTIMPKLAESCPNKKCLGRQYIANNNFLVLFVCLIFIVQLHILMIF